MKFLYILRDHKVTVFYKNTIKIINITQNSFNIIIRIIFIINIIIRIFRNINTSFIYSFLTI